MLAPGRQSDLPKKPPADASLSDVRLSIALQEAGTRGGGIRTRGPSQRERDEKAAVMITRQRRELPRCVHNRGSLA